MTPLSEALASKTLAPNGVASLTASASGERAEAFWLAVGDPTIPTAYADWLFVPVMLSQKMLGYLALAPESSNRYSESQVSTAHAFAANLAEIISRECQYREALRSSAELLSLVAVEQALASRLELESVLQLIADEARELTGARVSLLMLVVGDRLRTVAKSGPHSEYVYVGYEIPLHHSCTGKAVLTKAPVRVMDATTCNSVFRNDHLAVHSFISVPLISGSTAIGAFMVADKLSGVFGDDDERIATMFASSAVIALQNARLHDEEKRCRRDAERRQQIAEGLQEIQWIVGSEEMGGEALSRVAARACQLLCADACGVFMARDDARSFRLLAQSEHAVQLATDRDYVSGEQGVGLASRAGKPIMLSAVSQTDHTTPWTGDGTVLHQKSNLPSDQCSLVLAVPISSGGIPYGELLFCYGEDRAPASEDLITATAIAERLALAILSTELRARADDLTRRHERQQIARNLHDSVAQMLFALDMEASNLLQSPGLSPSIEQAAQTIRRLARRSSHELRITLSTLQERCPSAQSGIIGLLEEAVGDFRVQSDIPITCIVPPEVPELPSAVTEAIYRIVRESLSNAAKYSMASAVVVNLSCDGRSIVATIQDDGVGLPSWVDSAEDEEQQLHFGVAMMRQLALENDGLFTIRNADEHGVIVKARFPVAEGIR